MCIISLVLFNYWLSSTSYTFFPISFFLGQKLLDNLNKAVNVAICSHNGSHLQTFPVTVSSACSTREVMVRREQYALCILPSIWLGKSQTCIIIDSMCRPMAKLIDVLHLVNRKIYQTQYPACMLRCKVYQFNIAKWTV